MNDPLVTASLLTQRPRQSGLTDEDAFYRAHGGGGRSPRRLLTTLAASLWVLAVVVIVLQVQA